MTKYSGPVLLRTVAIGAAGVSGLITARLLAPEQRGVFAFLSVPITYVLSFTGTGMRQPVAKLAPEARDPAVISGTVVLATVVGLVAAAGWAAARTGALPGAAAGALCAGMVVFAFLEAVAIGAGEVTRVLWAQLAAQGCFLAVAPLLYGAGLATPVTLVVLQLLGYVTITITVYRREFRVIAVRPLFSSPAVTKSIEHGVATLGLTLLCRIDVLTAAIVLPSASLGQYAVAASFGELLSQFPSFAGFLLFAETPRETTRKRARVYRIVARVLVVASVVGAAMAFLVPPVVRAFLGARYVAASALFAMLVPAYVLSSALRVAAGFIAAVGETRLLIWMTAVGSATMVLLVAFTRGAHTTPPDIALFAALSEIAALAVLLAFLRCGPRYD